MDIATLRRGDKVRTVDGALAEVLSPSEDGRWIRVRYVESPADPQLVDTEDLCSENELVETVEQ